MFSPKKLLLLFTTLIFGLIFLGSNLSVSADTAPVPVSLTVYVGELWFNKTTSWGWSADSHAD